MTSPTRASGVAGFRSRISWEMRVRARSMSRASSSVAEEVKSAVSFRPSP
ncbi:MAG: hypothetical protein ACLGH3_08325 [Actinomycetota bacterium]